MLQNVMIQEKAVILLATVHYIHQPGNDQSSLIFLPIPFHYSPPLLLDPQQQCPTTETIQETGTLTNENM
jgi:hypothetical protein